MNNKSLMQLMEVGGIKRNNQKPLLNKEGWGDQKCIFWSPNTVAYGEEKKR